MPVHVSTLEEVLALAKSLKVLRPDQLAHILEIAPKMGETDLVKVKESLLKIKTTHEKEMKEKMEVLHSASAVHKGWEAGKVRVSLEAKESQDQSSQVATAEALLQTLNN